MPIDINKVKQKLSQLQAKGKKNADGSFEKIDFKKVYWKPKIGKQIVRFVPFKNNPSMPFIEVQYHNFIEKKKMLALTNFGEKDPVVEFSNQLKSSTDKIERDYGYKMAPKTKYVGQLVPRGEEHLGTRLWEMNKTTSEQLLAIIADDDYGDILDVNEGFDITVEGVEDTFNNITYIKANLMPKRKPSALAETEDEIKGFLTNQYDPLTLTKKYSYDEMKDILTKWVNAGEETEQESEDEEVVENIDEASKDDIDKLPFVEKVDQASEDEEPPFDPDPLPEPEVTPSKSAIAAASKKVIAKNNAEIKAAAEKVKTSRTNKTKAETKVEAKKDEVSKGGDTQSKKDKFAALFGKK